MPSHCLIFQFAWVFMQLTHRNSDNRMKIDAIVPHMNIPKTAESVLNVKADGGLLGFFDMKNLMSTYFDINFSINPASRNLSSLFCIISAKK